MRQHTYESIRTLLDVADDNMLRAKLHLNTANEGRLRHHIAESVRALTAARELMPDLEMLEDPNT